MNKFLASLKVAGIVVQNSTIKQLQSGDTWIAAVVLGLQQGLKYNGNFKRGVVTGVTVAGVYCAANTAYNTVVNWDTIKDAYDYYVEN